MVTKAHVFLEDKAALEKKRQLIVVWFTLVPVITDSAYCMVRMI